MQVQKEYCPICGAPLKENQSTCNNCGESFKRETEIVHHTAQADQHTLEQDFSRSVISPEKISKTIRCSSCNYDCLPSYRFCPNCGEPLKKMGVHKKEAPKGRKPKRNESIKHLKSGKRKFEFEAWHIAALFISTFVIIVIIILSGNSNSKTEKTNNSLNGQTPQINLQAIQNAKQYIDANPDDADGILRYANVLHDAKMLDQAIVNYKKYISFVPDNPDAQIDLGICFFELKQYPEAINIMEATVKKHPEHQLGKLNLGIVYLATDNAEKGIALLNEAIALNPNSDVASKAKEILTQSKNSSPKN